MRGCISPLYRLTHFLESKLIGDIRGTKPTNSSFIENLRKEKEKMGQRRVEAIQRFIQGVLQPPLWEPRPTFQC